mmetsp:Transcript_92994/g.262606  ORF Transcript_92994/g.262606 Transcript_92994/m.262606 type:complete len:212 (-) Transcript_92994:572-1207(-)
MISSDSSMRRIVALPTTLRRLHIALGDEGGMRADGCAFGLDPNELPQRVHVVRRAQSLHRVPFDAAHATHLAISPGPYRLALGHVVQAVVGTLELQRRAWRERETTAEVHFGTAVFARLWIKGAVIEVTARLDWLASVVRPALPCAFLVSRRILAQLSAGQAAIHINDPRLARIVVSDRAVHPKLLRLVHRVARREAREVASLTCFHGPLA